jgi:TatD DNase family protein
VSARVLVDSHCHLDFPDFAEDMDGVLARAREAGIGRLVTISTRVRRFSRILALVEGHEDVFGTVGTHPHNAHEELDITAEALANLAEHPKIVGIGEAGLDFHYDNSPREAQEQGLRTHVHAARLTGLPLVIHARSADEAMIGILEEEFSRGAFKGVLHCFSSGAELARRGVELGLYLSFSGIISFKKSEALRDIARAAPADRLLVETDAPYLAPEPHRGRRNEPAFVRFAAEALARARGVTADEIATRTTDNFFELFRKVPRPAAAVAAA